MKATKQIDIYLTKKHNVRLIDVVQYDTGIQLVFTVKDFTIPSGTTATLYVQKPSGKFVYQENGITVSGNTVTINLENQAIAEHGKVPYQVSLKSGSDVITTFAGVMMVEKSLKDAGTTESVTVIRAFDEAVSDHVAEFQTKAEQIVQACIATLPDNYTTMEAKVNELANAVKGYLSGAVVFADDVSPVEHNPVVKVHGKNLFNKNKYAIIDKTLMFDISMLKVGKEYVLTSNRPITWFKISTAPSGHNSVSCSDSNGMYEIKFVMARNRNIPASSTQYLLLSVNANFSSNPVKSIEELDGYNIQIEEGTVATEYTPYLDPSTVCVKRCKKNLLKNTAVYQSTDGITFNMDGEGGVVCYGTSTQYVFLTVPVYLAAGRYILSGCPAGGSETTYSNIFNAGNDVFYYDTGNGVEFEITEDGEYDVYLCRFCPGVYVSGAVFNPMIRVADCTDNIFEAYNGAEYVPSSDGTVSGLTSVSPNMTILTDTAGAIVECEYNRDTNKVIDKLINAITAIGGTV